MHNQSYNNKYAYYAFRLRGRSFAAVSFDIQRTKLIELAVYLE